MIIRAHAKINWSLNILGLRPNGYHELDMLMQSIDLADTLTVLPADTLSLSIDGSELPADDSNLVLRAARALNSASGTRNGAQLRLTKRIPARAGMGGGSADCAATLIALNRMWGLGLSTDELLRIALPLGADVPFCLLGGLRTVRGIGERLGPSLPAPELPLVLVTPGGGLSTGAVFSAWDHGSYPIPPCDMDVLAHTLTQAGPTAAQPLSFNALEAPAVSLMPEIGTLMQTLRTLGASFVRMTGSGSTVFAVFDTSARAQAASAQIPGSIVAHTTCTPFTFPDAPQKG